VLINRSIGFLSGCKMKITIRGYPILFQNKFKIKYFFRIPGEYRIFVYCAAIQYGSINEWEFASKQYDKEQDPSQKYYLQGGMSCTQQTALIERYLNDQINASKVRTPDSLLGISLMRRSNLTWPFVKDHFQLLEDQM
jgi:hypothetical protein